MLVGCLVSLYAFFLTFTYGIGAYRIATGAGFAGAGEPPRIDLLCLMGLCLITVLLGFLSIFFPVGLEMNIFLVVLALVYLAADRNEAISLAARAFKVSATWKTWLIWLPCLVAIILYSALSPSMFDSGLYHAQTVQWIEKYKAVKGLGNLHDRLAFNSSFFLPCAFFGFSFLKAGPFHLLNAFLTMLFSFSLVSYLTCPANRTRSYGIICGILFYFLFRLIGDHYRIPSPTPDSLATFLIWFVVLAFLFRHKSDAAMEYDFLNFGLICLAFFSVTVKLSTFPLLLVVPYILFQCRHTLTKGRFFLTGAAAFIIVAPWVLRNIILSGYLVFPFPALDLFSFDWKIPRADAIYAMDFIRGWTRIPFPEDPAKALSLPLLTWFPLWFDEHRTIDKVIFVLASLSPLYLLFHWRRLKEDMDLIVIWAVSYVGVIYWFISAPDPRFGYGFMCVAISLALYALGTHVRRDFFSSPSFRAMIMLFAFVWGIYISGDAAGRLKKSDSQWLAHRWLTPGKYTKVESEVTCIGNLCVSVATSGVGACWYAPVPCTIGAKPGLRMRGRDLSDGFRIEGQ